MFITSIKTALFIALCLTRLQLLTGSNIVSCFGYLLIWIYHPLGIGYWLTCILTVNMYTNSSIRIVWNGICSAMFLVDSGVKQVWVMSPILFCIYLDGLLNLMDAAQIGCFMGRVFVDCLSYADDIFLLITITGAMCTQYACNLWLVWKGYNLVFNANKSKWLLLWHTDHSIS